MIGCRDRQLAQNVFLRNEVLPGASDDALPVELRSSPLLVAAVRLADPLANVRSSHAVSHHCWCYTTSSRRCRKVHDPPVELVDSSVGWTAGLPVDHLVDHSVEHDHLRLDDPERKHRTRPSATD